MTSSQSVVVDRCCKLGLECSDMPTDQLSSALAALSCFPMYMVANVDAWTSDRQWHVPILDLPGSEHLREALALGMQEGKFDISKEHGHILGTLVSGAKPCDLVIYEYALETLRQAMAEVTAPLAEKLRIAVARMIVVVAEASGEGLLGTGPKVSPQEEACIKQIDSVLSLSDSTAAAAVLTDLL